MKIAWFKREINPELGTGVAGYDFSTKSKVIHDNLYMTGLCMDDGENKALIISFDLLALDGWYIRNLQKECAEILNTRPEMILFSCTHNHSGPEAATPLAPNHDKLNVPYTEKLHDLILEETGKLRDFRECDVTFYSSKCDENRNRRYTTADNVASFTPHRREVVPLATEYADKELGQLCFIDNETRLPIYLIGNYAAHPLAGHAPGLGGITISADFPGVFRNYVTAETGAECMFISGAAGDLVPKEDELGSAAVNQMGINLAKAAIGGMIDAPRNPGRFEMTDAKVGAKSKFVRVPIRKRKKGAIPTYYDGKDALDLEMQVVAIGDICFVGVPGELCCELGQEIKWHSPFRKAFIAYNATGYLDYIGHANMLVSGGYEGNCQLFTAKCGLMLLTGAADAMFELRDELYPTEDGEIYPDCVNTALVNIPANR